MGTGELMVQTQLLNRKVKNSLLVVTAHKVGKDTRCVIGVISNGNFETLIDPKIIKNTSPSISHLSKAIVRLQMQKSKEIEGDARLKMAVSFLSSAIYKLFD